jgi:hypothetical protein
MDSVIPALSYTRSCSSSIMLQNLAEVPVTVDIEAHHSSGALAPVEGQAGMAVKLAGGQQAGYKLHIEDEDSGVWVKVREHIPEPRTSPAVAVSGITECTAADRLRTVARMVAYPMRNPWFSSPVSEFHGAVITLINTTAQPELAWACYSAGNLYSVPSPTGPPAQMQPVCSSTLNVQVPPYGSREIPVEREGTREFWLKTRGDAIVLQMLRPADEIVRIFKVDSTIRFGEEVPAAR